MELILAIDDLRNFPVGVEVARTPVVALRYIERNHKNIGIYYFDYDLGEETTGYTILMWALQAGYIQDGAKIYLVTSDLAGKRNMHRALERHNFFNRGSYYAKQ